ncbi:MAG: hypothetical protein CL624_09370 [Arcobacter sp.]|nr:hypothetical protein [Arcobacter sp.]
MEKNNQIKNNKKQQKTYEERSKEYLEKNIALLQSGGSDARVVIANTIESKELLSKLITVDGISKKAREQVGGKLSIEKFTALNTLFNDLNKLMDEVIELGTEEGLFYDSRTKKFSYNENRLNELLAQGKNVSEISKEIKIDEIKVTNWIKLIESRNEITANTKKESVETKTEIKAKKETKEKVAS